MDMKNIFRFFDLPPELRSAILTQVLVVEGSIILHNNVFVDGKPSDLRSFLSIFLVNMQMYQEASAIFYTENRFILNAQSHRLPVHLTRRGGFLSEEAQDPRRRVRNLSIYLTRVGGEFERVLGPILSDMILSGSLRNLRVRIGPPSYSPSRELNPDMIQRPPFQALLNLLADPYLEKVELVAWRVHLPIFCAFHQRTDLPARRDSESLDGQGLAILRNGPDWVKLDWKAMVSTYGQGLQIVRIGERTY